MNILLVSPKTPDTFWSFSHAVKFVSKRAAFPPLGLLTVAGMLPASWNLRLVDLNVRSLRDKDIRWADYVLVSAMIVHKESVREVVDRCQRMNRRVVGGGPLFTTGSAACDDIDCVVVGEAEQIMDDLIHDLETGQLRSQYEAKSRPDITLAPIPRWDLIHAKHYVTMPVQFSRGCPYDCEFCDIVVMNGRKPRTKPPRQMIAELEVLRSRGWEGTTFVVDDNFIGNKARVKEFLAELIKWRERTGARMRFITEASVNLADDPELMDLMTRAGFHRVFVGIETPNASSLEECQKHHNARRDMVESIRTIQRSGLEVMGGFIVGFDNDPSKIFDLQFEFIQRTGIVTAMVGLLTALPKTRLYQRLSSEGRLRHDSSGNNTDAVLNFVPHLDRDFLVTGYRQLMRSLYEPATYYERIMTLLKEYQPKGPRCGVSRGEIQAFLKSLYSLGMWHRGRRAYWKFLATVLVSQPEKFAVAVDLAIWGHHFRRVAESL